MSHNWKQWVGTETPTMKQTVILLYQINPICSVRSPCLAMSHNWKQWVGTETHLYDEIAFSGGTVFNDL